MIVLFGSILALAASIFIYFKSKRENFSLIMSDIVYELTFNGYWASKELVKDIVFAYNNKTGEIFILLFNDFKCLQQ